MFWSPLKHLQTLSRERRERREMKVLMLQILEELQSVKVLSQIVVIEVRQLHSEADANPSPPRHRGS